MHREQENKLLTRYKMVLKTRPDVLICGNLKKFRNNEYYFCGEDKKHSDLLALTSSQTMDKITSFFSQMDINDDSKTIQNKALNFIENILNLKKGQFLYGEDWKILRVEISKLI